MNVTTEWEQGAGGFATQQLILTFRDGQRVTLVSDEEGDFPILSLHFGGLTDSYPRIVPIAQNQFQLELNREP